MENGREKPKNTPETSGKVVSTLETGREDKKYTRNEWRKCENLTLQVVSVIFVKIYSVRV
jgi:hypothetical protein